MGEVILVETKEEEEEGLSLRLWVVAITLAVIVTLALLTITLLVCLRYRRLSLVPMETVEQVEGSTSSYDSRHGLLYSYNYPPSQSGKLAGKQSLERQPSADLQGDGALRLEPDHPTGVQSAVPVCP